MSSEDLQLLRRPCPPKRSPSHCTIAESTPTQVHEESKTGRRKEWSGHGNALPSPPRSFLPAEAPIMPCVNSFPSRPRRIIPKARILTFLGDDPHYAPPPPDVLQDFLKPTQSESEPVQSSQSQKEVIKDLSRWNYRKFINHFLSELHDGQQREVARQVLSCEPFPRLERRIPQWQIKCVVLSFHGSCRSHAPSLAPLNPSEHAVVDCLKKGGTVLNLKAHFIHQLPDLSRLISSLTYLNLSFNDFRLFPVELCELYKLEVLMLRGNPIVEIPAEIEKLINLKMLVVSFCKLTALPSQLYNLSSLQHLDVSHNLIGRLSNKIMSLRSLRYLNVEGNLLASLPRGLLRLPLSQHV
ncbi:hypothetical protein Q7C36_009278 [Tachysurus vachellii]|uniref:Disease resistance R13L4/SHOC-2-like LRR domain-containing protein n=1 Tax=Tachysurus vachellii TaxID=175792 RepID=A0AA88N348_TACVA|nr:hypothetical protein Q7C36_009278 [Tachysurus vachellii]